MSIVTGIKSFVPSMVNKASLALATSPNPILRSIPVPMSTNMTMKIPPRMRAEDYTKAFGSIGWLYAVVSKIASSVSEVDWQLYSIRNGERQGQLESHPLLELLEGKANPFQSGDEVRELHQMYMDLPGESFWILNRDNRGIPTEIWIVPPSRMTVVPSPTDFIDHYEYRLQNFRQRLEIGQVIHFKTPNPVDMYRGQAPVAPMATELDTERFATEWNRNMLFNSATPEGILRTKSGRTTPEQKEEIKQMWKQQYSGWGASHSIAVLTGDLEYQAVSLSPRDMDHLNLRKLGRDNILGLYGVPQHIMGLSENVNLANAREAENVYGRHVLRTRLRRIRNKLNMTLVPMFGGNIELDFTDPAPQNRVEQVNIASRELSSGAVTVNEYRKLLGFDQVPGGDVYLRAAGLIEVPVNPADRPPPMMAIGEDRNVFEGGMVRMINRALNGAEETIYRRSSDSAPTNDDESLPVMPKSRYTTEQKEIIWHQFVTDTEAMEAPVVKVLQQLFEDQADDLVRRIQGIASIDDLIFPLDEFTEIMEEKLLPMLIFVFEQGLDAGDALVHPEQPHTDGIRKVQLNATAMVWIRKHVGEAIVGINEITRKAVVTTLLAGFTAEEGIPALQSRIRSVMSEASVRRSRNIARTEVITMSNRGTVEGYIESGVVDGMEWLTSLDGRQDSICEALNGVVVDLHKNFPGGFSHPPAHPSCRCTVVPVIL